MGGEGRARSFWEIVCGCRHCNCSFPWDFSCKRHSVVESNLVLSVEVR